MITMMKIRGLLALMTLSVIMLLLAACGGTASSPSTVTASLPTALSTPTSAPAPAKTPVPPTFTPTATPRPTSTSTPSPMPTPTPTEAATSTPTASPTAPPPPSATPASISFSAAIQPIFSTRCVKCHAGNNAPRGLLLDSYEHVLQGSARRPVVLPGDADASQLVRRIRGEARPRMPFDGPPFLTEEQIMLIVSWIAEGAPNN